MGTFLYGILVWVVVPLLLLIFLGINIRYSFVHRTETGCLLLILGSVGVFLILYGFNIRLALDVGQRPAFLIWPLLLGALFGFLMTWLAFGSQVTVEKIPYRNRSAADAKIAVGETLAAVLTALTLLLYFAIRDYQSVIFSASLGLPIGTMIFFLWGLMTD